MVVAILGVVVAAGAAAQSSPYYIGASQAFSRDSNIFRSADGTPKTSDIWSTTSLLAGIDQPIGRQRVYADAAVRHNKYQDIDRLDNTGYSLGFGVDWATIERLSGRLRFNATQALANYGAGDTPQTTERNIERSQEALASVRLGGDTSILNLEGTLSHRELDYSLASFNPQEYRRDTAGVRVIYRPSGALALGAGVRHTEGKFPRFTANALGGFVADEYTRDDLDLTATWEATGASRINARITYSDQSHDDTSARDFSDVTGAVAWDWRPTGKLRFVTELARDSGQELNALSSVGGTISAVGDTSRLADQLQVQAFYDVTAKIQLNAFARYTHRSLVNTLSLAGGGTISAAGTDNTSVLAIGARYNPTRTIQIGCSAGTESRNADSAVSYDYKADYASCFAQILLR